MIGFTRQERTVLSVILAVVLAGLSFNFLFQRYPELKDLVNLIDSPKLYPKVNINTATKEELVSVPYIGEYTATNIIKHRESEGPFQEVVQLKEVKGIRDKNFAKFKQYLEEDLGS